MTSFLDVGCRHGLLCPPYSAARGRALAILALHAALPVALAAQGQVRPDRWVPSVALISGITLQEWDGAVSSEICRGCSFPDPKAAEPLRDPDESDDLDVTPYFGGNLELMTPQLPLPGSPRLFVG